MFISEVINLFWVCPFKFVKFELKYRESNTEFANIQKNLLCGLFIMASKFSRKKTTDFWSSFVVYENLFFLSCFKTSIWFAVHKFYFFIITDHVKLKHAITFQDDNSQETPLLLYVIQLPTAFACANNFWGYIYFFFKKTHHDDRGFKTSCEVPEFCQLFDCIWLVTLLAKAISLWQTVSLVTATYSFSC